MYKKISGIYTITNLIDGKMYVGCSENIKKRFHRHLYELKHNRHHSFHLQKAVNKYGLENFKLEILEECLNQQLFSQENYWVQMLCTYNRNYGYNIKASNPDNKGFMCPELKEKLRILLSERSKGKKNYFYGKKGILSPMYGKYGNKHHNFGKKQNLEWVNNATKTRYKSIIQMDLESNFIKEWDSIINASLTLKIPRSNINNCCLRNRKTAGKFKWKYKNENILT